MHIGHKNTSYLYQILTEKATESLARTHPSGLPWILSQPQVFGCLNSVPIQSNPRYGPNMWKKEGSYSII